MAYRRISYGMVLLAAAAIVAAVTAAPSATGATGGLVVKGSAVGPIRLGHSTLPSTSGSLAQRRAHVVRRGSSCTAVWSTVGLTVTYSVIGSDTRNPCVSGVAVTAKITGRPQWHTTAGLRVGDPASRLHLLYPKAPLRRYASEPAGYWLVSGHACEAIGGFPYPSVLARLRGTRVSSFVARIAVCD